MSIILPFFLAAILLFSFTTNISAQETEEEKPPNNDIIVDAMMQINLVMIGDTWSQEEQKAIGDKLLKSYMPNIYYEERAAGVNYTYNYSFRNMTAEKSDELVTYIDAIAEDPPADWMPYIAEWISFVAESREEIPPFVNLRNDTYKMISAFAVEEWLAKLERDKGYTIYFLKPVNEKVNYFLEEPSEAKVNYFHTYGTVDTDPDTGIEFIQQGMMGFGGKYRFYFIDLNAGPWLYPYPQFHKNIFDIETEDEYHELIAGYVNNALLLLFTPSYLYSPVYKLNHKIDIFLIDYASGRVFHDVADKYINKSTIESALAKLIPYAKWSSNIQEHNFDSLPRELQRTVLRSLTFKDIEGTDGIILVRSSDLIIELNKWVASNLSSEQAAMAEEEAEETMFIPVIIFVFDKAAYVDREGSLGTAVPDPADNTIPCCAVVAIDKHSLFDIGAGLSFVTIHEMGHVLGLRHPHDGSNPTQGEFFNWFFDWSYTPMTYSSPSSFGCGLGFVGCGMVITEFGQFNYDALDRGMVLYLLNQAQSNIRDSMLQIEEKGYEKNIPTFISTKMPSIDTDMEKAKEHFAKMTYFNHTTFKDLSSIMDPMDDA
ncbi:MAG: hypothetical protein V3T40_02525, partial [Nitrososphaerales archaeon]